MWTDNLAAKAALPSLNPLSFLSVGTIFRRGTDGKDEDIYLTATNRVQQGAKYWTTFRGVDFLKESLSGRIYSARTQLKLRLWKLAVKYHKDF